MSVFKAEVFLIYQGEKLLTFIAHDVTFLFRIINKYIHIYTRWFKYDRDYLCVNKSQFVPVIFEPPCTLTQQSLNLSKYHILFLFMVRNSSSGNINN
jgi:hypothetical protein